MRANESFVHHMDLFVCDGRAVEPPDRECLYDDMSERGPCYAMVWAYDKGALRPYALPADAGFRLGAGTPFSALMLQVHYQLPYGGVTAAQLHAEGYHDASGVVATLLPAPSRPRGVPKGGWPL